jgi:hypothetical protein
VWRPMMLGSEPEHARSTRVSMSNLVGFTRFRNARFERKATVMQTAGACCRRPGDASTLAPDRQPRGAVDSFRERPGDRHGIVSSGFGNDQTARSNPAGRT